MPTQNNLPKLDLGESDDWDPLKVNTPYTPPTPPTDQVQPKQPQATQAQTKEAKPVQTRALQPRPAEAQTQRRFRDEEGWARLMDGTATDFIYYDICLFS